MIEAEEEEDSFEEAQQDLHQDFDQEEIQISVHALSGIQSYRTMKVIGHIKKSAVHILIDSGSTHNFLDPKVAKSTGAVIQATSPLIVTVADGTRISSKAMVKNCQWTMQGTPFNAEMRLLPLGGCDMVLGVQWLSTLGPVLWDFKQLQMEFTVGEKKHVLKGDNATEVQLVNAKRMQHMINKGINGVMAQVCSIQVETTQEVTSVFSPDILQILHSFEEVFSIPKELPPTRTHDHQIHS